jgi:hypothetical protein
MTTTKSLSHDTVAPAVLITPRKGVVTTFTELPKLTIAVVFLRR